MTIREEMEQAEHTFLVPWAAFSDQTKGRLRPEEENEVRTCYQRDVDRIVYSKSFRRLKHKTQVFLQPEGDHYRTRLTHTLEVMRISRTIARALKLNEDLTEAIAFGHDLGHTPFGHAGEKALRQQLKAAEDGIAATEERISDLKAQMGLPEVYSNPDEAARVAREHREAQERLDALYESWEALEAALSEREG